MNDVRILTFSDQVTGATDLSAANINMEYIGVLGGLLPNQEYTFEIEGTNGNFSVYTSLTPPSVFSTTSSGKEMPSANYTGS